MTTFRQFEANRRNARKSTGPATEEGKRASRCNAVRHGLTAETVIGVLEDAEDYKAFEAAIIADYDRVMPGITPGTETAPSSQVQPVDDAADLARCFLRLANLPNFALDRLSRYEAILWRQVSQILFALDALDRRKPQDRGRRFHSGSRRELPAHARDDY